jgi:lysophospholipase L1-like esterase
MDWFEPEVRELERARLRRRWPPDPTVFYGSSSIRLWTTLAEDLRDPRAVNLGFGGSTLEACVRFFDRLVPPMRPAALVVYAGDNDLGDGRTPGQVVGWFRQLMEKVDRDLPPIPFAFMSIKPSPSRAYLAGPIWETNETIRRDITRHPNAFYIDVFTPMLKPGGYPRRELFLDDGLHLSRAGYEVWAEVLGKCRDRIFSPSTHGGQTAVLPSDGDGP